MAASSCVSFRLSGASRASQPARPASRSCAFPLCTAAPALRPRQTSPRSTRPWSSPPHTSTVPSRALPAVKAVEDSVDAPPHPITISATALKHMIKLRDETEGDNLCLRMGVKQGGCSGLSYHMDFEEDSNITDDDMVMEYDDGFKLVCDPKSLLYLFGMQLDYSNELIGGGFQFLNPNAENSCGCGKSFAA